MTEAVRFTIEAALAPADVAVAAGLFTAYAESLGVDLGYQNFQAELESLPGKYAPPDGAMLLARNAAGMALGCVALRPIAPAGCCEMKRLYVMPAGRGLGIGKALIDAIVVEARRIGYHELRLDTLPTMSEAIALYRKLGFRDIAPYYVTPIAGTFFLARDLRAAVQVP